MVSFVLQYIMTTEQENEEKGKKLLTFVTFFNPITVGIAIAFLCFWCSTHVSGCYDYCKDMNTPEGKYDIHVIGSVVTPDGETCKIEQVDRVEFALNTPDEIKRCLIPGEASRKPMVRRLICPSGKNGQSSVTDDGTKFHREIIQLLQRQA